MKFMALASFLFFAMALSGRGRVGTPGENAAQAGQAVPITQEPHHHLLYENADMRIFDVTVPPHESTLLHEHDNDYIFIALGDSVVTEQRPGQSPVELALPDGSVRFARGGFAHTLTNDADRPFHNVTIEFLRPELTEHGCSCTGGPADAVCACPNAPPLPANWALRVGRVSLTGVTLAPGAAFDDTSTQTTRFLVAITPLDVMDSSDHSPKNLPVRVPEGRFHWLAPGPHKIQNLSSQPVRFVSVGFWGTPQKSD